MLMNMLELLRMTGSWLFGAQLVIPKPELQIKHTPPKINIAPEKWWLEEYFPFGMVFFEGLC